MAEKNNVVLIGMPGSGKSTLGIVLAKIMTKDFIDADIVIQNQCDKTLQKIIDACGPEGFIESRTRFSARSTRRTALSPRAVPPCTPMRL